MSLCEKFTLEDLPESQWEIAEVVGMETYIALTQRFGGSDPYIVKYSEIAKSPRNEEIRRAFTGYNYYELAAKYDLSERYIRELVKDITQKIRAQPISGQVSFDEL